MEVKLNIKVGDKEISLSMEEAQSLYYKLQRMIQKEIYTFTWDKDMGNICTYEELPMKITCDSLEFSPGYVLTESDGTVSTHVYHRNKGYVPGENGEPFWYYTHGNTGTYTYTTK